MGEKQSTLRPTLKPGDHIYTDRAGGIYHRHGIYVGDDMVIHLMGPAKINNSSSSSCKNCGYNRDRDNGIVKTCLDCFLDGHSLYIVLYDVPEFSWFEKVFLVHRLSYYYRNAPKPPDEVVKIATEFLHGNKDFGKYNFAFNNCEDFASFCKTGFRSSSQRDEIMYQMEQAISRQIQTTSTHSLPW